MLYSVGAGSKLVLPLSVHPSSPSCGPTRALLSLCSVPTAGPGSSERDSGDVSGLGAWRIAGQRGAPWPSDAWVGVRPCLDNVRWGLGISPLPRAVFRGTLGTKWGPPEASDPSRALSFFCSFPSDLPRGGLSLPRALGRCSQGCQLIPPPTPLVFKGVICI